MPEAAKRTVNTKKKLISAGLGHSVVVLESGDVVTFGLARQYQLGLDYIKEKERRNGKTEADLVHAILDRIGREVRHGA